MSACPHGYDLECRLCPNYQDQLDEENYKRCLDRMFEERALEAAVVEAAMAHDLVHGNLNQIVKDPHVEALDVACAALRAFRDRSRETGKAGR